MAKYQIKNSKISGELFIPPSKSHTLRAILFAALAKGRSRIEKYLLSPDAQAMIQAARSFGATVEQHNDAIEVMGLGSKVDGASDVIYAGNSGIVLRFASAIGGLAKRPVVITGDHSICYQRPMLPLIQGLRQLGASVESMRGDEMAPLIIKGPLRAGSALIDGQDSQPVSALLIASSFAPGPIHIAVENAGEKPWVALTLYWLDKLGISYAARDFSHYEIKGGASVDGFSYKVPGDLSTVSFPVAAALITNSELVIHNVDMLDPQGDKELIYTLQKMGAQIEIDQDKKMLVVKKGPKLQGIDVDINSFIDAITILATIACYAEGTTTIRNAKIAKTKECDRIKCITQELKKMGADIEATDDGLTIRGKPLIGAELHSHRDHRMAMALAIASLGAKGPSTIDDIECVAKTYPTFFDDFTRLGASLEVIACC